jgi:hypothetical protein
VISFNWLTWGRKNTASKLTPALWRKNNGKQWSSWKKRTSPSWPHYRKSPIACMPR